MTLGNHGSSRLRGGAGQGGGPPALGGGGGPCWVWGGPLRMVRALPHAGIGALYHRARWIWPVPAGTGRAPSGCHLSLLIAVGVSNVL